MHRHGRGFTLLELLVVIAIIAVLVALLFPTARGVYVAAMEFQCQNRIGQLAQVTMAYCAANKEDFPPPCSLNAMPSAYTAGWLYGTSPSPISVDNGLYVRQKMLGSKGNLVCPVHVSNFKMEPYQDAWQATAATVTTQKAHASRMSTDGKPIVMSSYAMNEKVWTDGSPSTPRKRRDFSPTHFLFVEEHPLSRYQDGSIGVYAGGRDRIADRHHGGGYVACMGGQVIWMSTADYDATLTTPEKKARRWDPN